MSFISDLLGWGRTFQGGLYLPDDKARTARKPIQRLSVSGPLLVPLQHAAHLPTRPLVAAGQSVRADERLAEPGSASSLPVFSPAAGRILRLARCRTVRDGWLPAAVLEPDAAAGERAGLRRLRDSGEGKSAPAGGDSLFDALDTAGIITADAREPLGRRLRLAREAHVAHLIVNAMETEPLLTADLRTLVERPGELIAAVERLGSAVGAGRTWLAAPSRHRRVLRRLRGLARGRTLSIAALPDKYPQCHPNLLVQTLLGRIVPPGGDPEDAGALVLPAATVWAVAEWLDTGRPCTSRIVTVAGVAAERPGNFIVPFGTPIRRLIEEVGLRETPGVIVAGGPLTGVAVFDEEVVTTPDVGAILLLAAQPRWEPVPCVRCGWCIEDCPVGLDPPALMEIEGAARLSTGDQAALRTCIECGLCSYVCPARLPLTESIAATRRRMRMTALRPDGPSAPRESSAA